MLALLLATLAPAFGQYAVTILEKGPVPAISRACARRHVS